ncbi:hypothetical protein ABW20_dc0107849 [Dactylellina cionopaga]|nr:hypothetical protein ABW20_dc0107849 [Dactylellina cionopaga]
MTDFIRKGLGAISQIPRIAGNLIDSVFDTITGTTSSHGARPQPMHTPGTHDYQAGGDYSSNATTHHSLHSSAAAATMSMGGPNKMLGLLTIFAALYLFLQMVPVAQGAVIARQTTSSSSSKEGGFTYYQINGDGTTETPVVLPAPLSTGDSSTTTASNYTSIFTSTHDWTVHEHISIIMEPETTDYVTDLVVETDVVTVTISDLDPNGGSTSLSTQEVTHTGTWIHTHLTNEDPHTASWTHSHVLTTPPYETGNPDGDADGHWPGDPDGQWDDDGDGHGPPGGPGTGDGINPNDGDGDGHWPNDGDGQWDDDGDGHGPPGGSGNNVDGDADGHWPGDPDGQWDDDGDGHGPPGGPGTGHVTNPNDSDGDGHWPGDPDGQWDGDGDGHGPPGGPGSNDGDGNGDGTPPGGHEGPTTGPNSHPTHHPPCPFDPENHSSDIDEDMHHSTLTSGQNTLSWEHDITSTYTTTNTIIEGGTTYINIETEIVTETTGEAIITTETVETRTVVEDGTTYTNVETQLETKVVGGSVFTTLTTETNILVDGGTTYSDVVTVTTTESHYDPVTTLDETAWTDHTATHPHNGGPTEFLPKHTHHHTFTIYSTFTSTITTDSTAVYTEWVSATTITL